MSSMDYGHYNCRDYHITPHIAPTTNMGEEQRPHVERHESFDELEERSRSPASRGAKFPLLELPLELRQQIFGYLLPRTQEFMGSGALAEHARNFSAVKKRVARGMIAPSGPSSADGITVSNVVWQKREKLQLLRVCKQLHDECTEMLYGSNTFLLFLTFNGISFRFRWLTPAGMIPSANKNFVELLPERYRHMIKRIVVHIDHVDSYLAMQKFGVDSDGLARGLQNQVQRLVDALQPRIAWGATMEPRRLAKVYIRVSNGNSVLDALKTAVSREREGDIKISQDIENILKPFGQLRGVQQVSVVGAVTETIAQRLEARMMSERGLDKESEERQPGCGWQADDAAPGSFASSDDRRTTNLAHLIRGF